MSFYSKFARHYESIFPFRSNTFSFLKEFLPASAATKIAPIVDVGCGSGHYAGALAKEGYRVLGIDLDEKMIDSAKSKYPEASFSVANILDPKAIEKDCSAAYSIGNVLPHLNTKQLIDFLQMLSSKLLPDSTWIFQTVNFDPLLALDEYEFPVISLDSPENALFERRYERIDDTSFAFRTRLSVSGKLVFEGTVPLYPISSKDYASLHENAGFKIAEHFGDFAAEAFDFANSKASIFVMKNMA